MIKQRKEKERQSNTCLTINFGSSSLKDTKALVPHFEGKEFNIKLKSEFFYYYNIRLD